MVSPLAGMSDYGPEHSGEALAYLMERQGLSCMEMARLTGVTHSAFVRWRQGRFAPKYRNAKRVAEALSLVYDRPIRVDEIWDPRIIRGYRP